MFRTCLLFLLLVPALAQADDGDDLIRPEVHVDAGMEVLGGGALSYGFRGQALVGARLGGGDRRLTVAAGGTYASGELQVADMRGLDGSVTLDLASWGPEVQAGVDFTHGTLAGSRLFGSFAVLHVAMDSRLRLDMVPGVTHDGGMRAAIGMNFAELLFQAAMDAGGPRDRELGGCLGLLAPQQIEVSWERDAGFDRAGVTVSWGI